MAEARIQAPAPDFTATALVDGDFEEISLSQYRAFSDRVGEFKSMNCEVLACSTDSEYSHLAWVNTPRKLGGLGQMNIPIIADTNHEISKKYGVLIENKGIALRGLFIVDHNGTLRQITVNDLPVGRSVDETIRLVQAFKFTDEHGEVCPAGWRPGADTIDPDVKKSKEYFKSQ